MTPFEQFMFGILVIFVACVIGAIAATFAIAAGLGLLEIPRDILVAIGSACLVGLVYGTIIE